MPRDDSGQGGEVVGALVTLAADQEAQRAGDAHGDAFGDVVGVAVTVEVGGEAIGVEPELTA